METTRIVLIDMPTLLREIVREAVAGEPDLAVVGEYPADVDLAEVLDRNRADFAIVGSTATTEGAVEDAFERRSVRVLEIRAEGRQSVLHELRPHRAPLGEISPGALLRAIRAQPGREAEQ